MASGSRKIFALILFGLGMVSTQQAGYEVLLVNRELDNGRENNITLRCTDNGQNGIPASNPNWYYNGSRYEDHICTAHAEKVDSSLKFVLTPECEGFAQCGKENVLSPPKRLLAYPVLVDGNSPRTITTMVDDDVIIPCGVRVSATGNFDVSWTERYIQGDKTIQNENDELGVPETLTSNYGLNVTKIQKRENHEFICTVKARTDHGDLVDDANIITLPGPVNNIDAVIYEKPRVNLFIMESQDGKSTTFTLQDTSGTGNQYTWSRNGIVLNNEMDGISISNSPPALTFNNDPLKNEDVIKAEVVNQNIHGEENIYTAHGFLFTLAPSPCINNTVVLTSTVTMVEPHKTDQIAFGDSSGIVNIVLLIAVFILLAVVAVLLGILLGKEKCKSYCRMTKKVDEKHNEDQLVVKVDGDKVVTFDKSKMNDVPSFIESIDAIIFSVCKHAEKNANDCLNKDTKGKIRKMQGIMKRWTVNPDRIQFDNNSVENEETNMERAMILKQNEENVTFLEDDDPFPLLFPKLCEILSRSSSTEEQ